MPSADLYARAIIASAVSFGDCPERAMLVARGAARRPIAPAIAAIARACDISLAEACRPLDASETAIPRARNNNPVGFARAQAEAEAAIRYALRTKALAERQEAPLAPAAPPQPIRAPQAAPVAPAAPPKTIAEVRRRQEARPKGRAIPRGATLQNVGNGVQIIRLKPITPELLARARQQIAKGVSIADFADLFDVDAERLTAALEGEAAA
jgi:hypothetical protein